MSTKLSSAKDSSGGLFLLYDGEVTKVGDEYDDTVIYTKTHMDNDEGEPTYPLLPAKYFHALPKKGNRVFVILKEYTQAGGSTQKKMKRYWIGPIEPQWQTVGGGSYDSKFLLEPDNPLNSRPPVKNINENKAKLGVYPNKDEVAIHNGNTDVILSDKIINIRAGKFIFSDKTKSSLNTENQGLINIKYSDSNLKRDQETEKKIKTVYTDPEYTIYVEIIEDVSTQTSFGYITITKISDNTVIEKTTSSTHERLLVPTIKRNMLVLRIQDQLRLYQRRYKRWQLFTNEPELLSTEKKFFPEYRLEVEEEVPKKDRAIGSSDKGSSVINVMANRINLFSYDGLKSYNNILNDKKEIDGDLQKLINKELQSIVYGEELLKFLRLVKTYITTHIHPYHGMPPIQDQSVVNISNFNLDDLLNKNIKTN